MDWMYYVWAKTGENDKYHLLIYHLLDVGAVAHEICKSNRMAPIIHSLSSSVSLNQQDFIQWLTFLAALHDIGKAYPGFQFHLTAPEVCTSQLENEKLKPEKRHLPPNDAIPHNLVSQMVFEDLLNEIGVQHENETTKRLAIVLGGHHGVHYASPDTDKLKMAEKGILQWNDIRIDITKILFNLFQLYGKPFPKLKPDDNATPLLLTGLISTSDWLASDQNWFPCRSDQIEVEEYWHSALKLAKKVLDQIGWNGWERPKAIVSFSDLFKDMKPRPLQETCITISQEHPNARLVIIEAPMGEGKTEAALYLQDVWMVNRQQSGAYFALPTMAASNQLFKRTKEFLEFRYDKSILNFLLLHSHNLFNDELSKLKSNSIQIDHMQDEGSLIANEWFIKPKKGLLAPFAVGTIDQALMAVLQVRYGFLRLLGLANKTLIFDEVHAYDTYMLTLFERLLQWLSHCNTTVVILSATLPNDTRRKMLKAFDCKTDTLPQTEYPRITVCNQEQSIDVIPVSASSHKTIHLDKVIDDCTFRKELIEKLENGGCVVWICNTVGKAQKLYEELKSQCVENEIELDIFHARFPLGQRFDIEKEILKKYGKEGERPHKSLLVATQVVEQSLDLDFDWMITEMAPVDLLLQRSGRMHRHDRERPPHFAQPTLSIIEPEMNEGQLPKFNSVYTEYILFRSWVVLRDKNIINIPEDMDALIQMVYSEKILGKNEDENQYEQTLKDKWEEENQVNESKAKNVILKNPSTEDILLEFNNQLDEENPDTHVSLQAATRLFKPSVTIVCFNEGEDITLPTNPIEKQIIIKNWIKKSVSLSYQNCVNDLPKTDIPDDWKRISILRFMRPVFFQNGIPMSESRIARLDQHIGIVLKQKGAKNEPIVQSDS